MTFTESFRIITMKDELLRKHIPSDLIYEYSDLHVYNDIKENSTAILYMLEVQVNWLSQNPHVQQHSSWKIIYGLTAKHM